MFQLKSNWSALFKVGLNFKFILYDWGRVKVVQTVKFSTSQVWVWSVLGYSNSQNISFGYSLSKVVVANDPIPSSSFKHPIKIKNVLVHLPGNIKKKCHLFSGSQCILQSSVPCRLFAILARSRSTFSCKCFHCTRKPILYLLPHCSSKLIIAKFSCNDFDKKKMTPLLGFREQTWSFIYSFVRWSNTTWFHIWLFNKKRNTYRWVSYSKE